jgi:glutamate synthase domain-containing protein 1
MCGIVGFLDKSGGSDHPIGSTLLAMLQALSCRGPDSAGVAVFGAANGWHLRISVPAGAEHVDPGTDPQGGTPIWLESPEQGTEEEHGAPEMADVVQALQRIGVAPYRHYHNGVYDASLSRDTDPETVEGAIHRQLPDAEILCLGRQLNLAKQVGSPDRLEATYAISAWTGSHGIGHTRLSTESRVDLSHSQPFWAHGVPDLATVHNGHITNYHKLRRHYEQRGYRFYTENDSEVIGVYLRDRLAAGLPLEDVLRCSLDDFDGSFSYLAANGGYLAYVRDRFGFKPLVVAETEAFVALATEEIALRQALGDDFVAWEPAPGTMQIWSVAAEQVAVVRETAGEQA